MRQVVTGLILCIGLLVHAGVVAADTAVPPSFEAAFQRHVEAVQARDLRALEPTLTRGDALTLILPNGTHTSTKAEYLAFHERFFAMPGWTIDFERISSVVAEDLAIVTTRSTFESSDENGTSRSQSWVTFIFQREEGDWRLIHDQNTRLPVP